MNWIDVCDLPPIRLVGKTYGDFSREEIDRIVTSPEFPEMMERAEKRMNAYLKQLEDRMDAVDPEWRLRLYFPHEDEE